ncbi:MAG: hypothetical protein SVK54_05875 [candidate division WOR-3 bacterium]|nr:hypothetical protein [candidate division WOR-3 bacterium]
MKRIVVIFLIVLFAVVSCDSVNEIKEAGKEVSKAVGESGKLKSAAENVKEGADAVKGMNAEDIEKPVLNDDDVFVYFNELKKATQKYPDIDFYSATTAAIQAGTEGLNLKDIIERETELTFEKYSQTSALLLTAQAEGQGLIMQEDILNSMKEGKKNAEEQVDVEKLSEEEKDKYLNQMKQLNKTIEETEKELQSENAERIRKNMQIIEEAKKKAGIE